MEFNRKNFYRNTFCVFTAAPEPVRSADYESRSGSLYWFSPNGVYRKSGHWGRAARCKWRLVRFDPNSSGNPCGFARWSDFAQDNDYEKLYFLRAEGQSVHYYHKSVSDHQGELLRTSAGTSKRIRKIRQAIKSQAPEAFVKLLIETDLEPFQINRVLSENRSLPLST